MKKMIVKGMMRSVEVHRVREWSRKEGITDG